jgi:hypothetical protein
LIPSSILHGIFAIFRMEDMDAAFGSADRWWCAFVVSFCWSCGWDSFVLDKASFVMLSWQRRTEHRIPVFSFKAIIMSCWIDLDVYLIEHGEYPWLSSISLKSSKYRYFGILDDFAISSRNRFFWYFCDFL